MGKVSERKKLAEENLADDYLAKGNSHPRRRVGHWEYSAIGNICQREKTVIGNIWPTGTVGHWEHSAIGNMWPTGRVGH